MSFDEERIALFIDYENLAIGAREDLGGLVFDYKPIADALANRGRVVVRRAYADWTKFEEDRRMLTRNHVELIEIPQRMGATRKNAADIKMAVDAIELAFERQYLTTIVICTGDSDFTPLVNKLRELNKRVIGVGVKASTSALLPPACDEFLFYESLEGVELPKRKGRGRRSRTEKAAAAESTQEVSTDDRPKNVEELESLITRTLAGLERGTGGVVLASALKRALLRKDATFSEAEYGFRAFGELLRHLESRDVIELRESSAHGDPEVSLPEDSESEAEAFELLRAVVADLERTDGPAVLSGLKNQVRKRAPDFTEKRFGYSGFLQFCKAADTHGVVELDWDDDADDYVLRTPRSSSR
jgi:uncharacterized protein (TIGR00288 family)